MRTIHLTGFIYKEAEKKVSKTGRDYITFRMCNNEYNDPKDADGKSKGFWVNVTSFNQNHFNLVEHLKKGKPIIVEGDFSDNVYTNKNGVCEVSHDVVANAIHFMSMGNSNSQNNGNQQQSTINGTIPQATITAMPSAKPTTGELNVPKPQANISDDDLPF